MQCSLAVLGVLLYTGDFIAQTIASVSVRIPDHIRAVKGGHPVTARTASDKRRCNYRHHSHHASCTNRLL
mgnify:CR=1 FL=1